MMRFLLILLIFSSINFIQAQKKVDHNKLFSAYAKKENHEKTKIDFFQKLNKTFSGEINEPEWIDAFLEAELLLYKDSLVMDALERGLKTYKNRSDKFIRQTIETAYTLYPKKFAKEVRTVFNSTNDRKAFSVATHYLLNNKDLSRVEILSILNKKFPEAADDPTLKFLTIDLENDQKELPPLSDLFRHPFQNNKTIIYSIHREDRRFPGLTIIKAPNGKFIRNADSSIFSIPQLALSATNLPGYMKNGNTPQGIFSVVGFYISPTETLGPTPNVLTRIPFEVSTKIFYHDEVKSSQWKLNDYKNLLPASWKNYMPVLESFYAGKSGRRLIVMHGSTDDLSFYEDQPFYPLTPTLGCLTTKEIWNEDGTNQESDQAELMNAFFSTGELDGFLVVVEIDDKKAPVNMEEILPFIKEGEGF